MPLTPLNLPSESFYELLVGAKSQSKLFLCKIRNFYCSQTTSFGTTNIMRLVVGNEYDRNFGSTFEIQSKVCHQIGSLLSVPDANPTFLQVYFMGDEEQQINTRC